MLLSIDGTFLVQILNFIVFWLALNYFFIGPTRRAIEERRRYVEGLYHEGDKLQKQAASLQSEADGILAAARRRTDEAMRAAAETASGIRHDIERTATEEATASVQLAHATVASELASARNKQQAFVGELARSMVARATEEVA